MLKKQILTKRFNSWSHIQKRVVQFCESYSKNIQFFALYFWRNSISTLSHVKCSILWVILKRKAQFFESCSKQGQSFLSDIAEKGLKIRKKSNPLSYIRKKKVQFFGSCKTESSIHRVNFWKGSILRVRFSLKNFNSQSHIFQERLIQFILWVMHFANKKKIFESFFNRVIFFDSCWKGFNLNESYCSKRVQFCESCSKKEFNSVSDVKKGQ